MKKFIAMLCVLCLAFALCACGNSGGDGSKAPAGDSLTFTTGGDTGTYYGYGSVLAQYVSSNSDISVTAVVGNGSQANVEDLNSGAVQLGFCQSDVMSYAYTGTNLFAETGAVDSFSVLDCTLSQASFPCSVYHGLPAGCTPNRYRPASNSRKSSMGKRSAKCTIKKVRILFFGAIFE